jgi:hypothetical protein
MGAPPCAPTHDLSDVGAYGDTPSEGRVLSLVGAVLRDRPVMGTHRGRAPTQKDFFRSARVPSPPPAESIFLRFRRILHGASQVIFLNRQIEGDVP